MKLKNEKLIAVNTMTDKHYPVSVKKNYEFSVDKKKIDLSVIKEADGFTIVSANGVRYPAEVISKKQNTYEILINGVSYTFAVETPFSLIRKKVLSANKIFSKNESIKAPVPGKILDIFVQPGQTIEQGKPLLILEAMKMQNIINSPVKGVITKISTNIGNTVAKNDMLIEIEKI